MSGELLTVYAKPAPTGYHVHLIGRGGEVIETRNHYPWFVASSPTYGRKLAKMGVVNIERLYGRMLKYHEGLMMYVPSEPAYKVECAKKEMVPRVAKYLKTMGATVGLYNITYNVRVMYDMLSEGYTLLGFRAPVALLPNYEMVSELKRAIDTISTIKVMVFDIEVLSTTSGFPTIGDNIASVTYSSFNLGADIFDSEWHKHNIEYILNEGGDRNGSFELVDQFIEVIRREKPDIIAGYNSSGFDVVYLRPFISDKKMFNSLGTLIQVSNRIHPHIDLMTVRKNLGSTLGLRSYSVMALDDVTVEAIRGLKVTGLDWFFESELLEAERTLDHAKLGEYFERRDEKFFNYIVADVYLTALLARLWLPSLLILSTLSGIQIDELQRMNTGRISEYTMTFLLQKLGQYPEIRERRYNYSKVNLATEVRKEVKSRIEYADLFELGKTYVAGSGAFGGGDKKVVELDFAQLYPTDMTVNSMDPTAVYVLETITVEDGRVSVRKRVDSKLLEGNSFYTMLSRDGKLLFHKVATGYGPISWFMYKMYTARKLTKEMKNVGKRTGRIEYMAPDQAIKIFNNSFYGAFAKQVGNMLHEVLASTVFWRTLYIQRRVIEAIENEIAEEIGSELKVIYSDTDSAFVLMDRDVDHHELVRRVNRYIHENIGPYDMELESVYSKIIIPKQIHSDQPSAKSYIAIDSEGKIAKITGEFYKLPMPIAIKDRLVEFYQKLIDSRIKSLKELEKLIVDFLDGEPEYKHFMKFSVSTYISEDDPSRFKTLNRPAHYAGLVTLCQQNVIGVEVLETRKATTITGEEKSVVKCRVDVRTVETHQKAVTGLYLTYPGKNNSRKFTLYQGAHEDGVEVLDVEVLEVNVETSNDYSENTRYDEAIVIKYSTTRKTINRDFLKYYVLRRLHKLLVEPLFVKLVSIMR